METTVGKALLKHYLPAEYHDYVEKTLLDKKGISTLFNRLAETHQPTYNEIVSNVARLGFEVATRNGSSVTLQDFLPPIDKHKEFAKLDKQIETLDAEGHSEKKHREKLFDIYNDFTADIDKRILEEGVKQNKTLAKIVVAGSRGSAAQYRGTVATQGIVVDAEGKPLLDFPIKSSFAEGLTLPEYLAHAWGARAGEVAKKLSVADSGYFSKQLSRAGMTLKIEEHDCGTDNGLTYPITDKDSIGAYLAHPVKNYKKNNEVTSTMLASLSNKGVKNIVIRSPNTCQASKHSHYGAICQMCAGRREKGLAEMGSYIGVVAASSAGEPLAQGAMNVRHGGGAASKSSLAGGFKLIEQFANIPKTFKDKAVVAPEDGVITDIKKSSAGGLFIHVNDKEHYVPVGFEALVKKGDKVEAGDVLSEGIVNPAEVVQHKGIGEGRKYYTDSMRRIFENTGMGVNRRNFEIIARSAIDHVKVTNPEGLGDYLPNEIVSYNAIEKDYKPRADSRIVRVDLARGMYLEIPVLHFTIGTRLSSRMIADLKEHKIESVTVNPAPPMFEPTMQRLLAVPGTIPDFAHQLYSVYLERKIVDSVNKGISNTANLKGPSPIMGIAYGAGFRDS